MINQLKEIEKVCKKHVANTSVINELQGEGVKCVINHSNGIKDAEFRAAKMWAFDVSIVVRDINENWEPVLKASLGIARDLIELKEHKWNVGDMERVEGQATEYAMSLSLTVFYHPGD